MKRAFLLASAAGLALAGFSAADTAPSSAAPAVLANVKAGEATRMVYEYLGRDIAPAIAAARNTGFVTEEDLLPYHRRLLRTKEPFS